ncbi:MAG: heme lyase CcmF/NrfE family subunit [Pseudomonadota bacterium]
MIPELGHMALIVALSIAFIQAFVPMYGAQTNKPALIAIARPAALAQALMMLISFLCLVYAFLDNDFSVAYVAQNSNTLLPDIFKVSAVWGAHEGSLLLWAFTLSIWAAAVSVFSKSIPGPMVARVLSVIAFVSIGFLLFMLITSNPFDRLVNAPLEGRDLNPLLQDFGLVIHPPMLYMGYVGFSVAFAFAIAAMLGGKLDTAWARWSRPWTNIAWVFLTGGVTLGSWWAYYELGWGGWWFWDPVENASFMPWLVGTALIHSLAATEKRGAFKAWTVLLAILAFSLSLLGTFLVRSGVLTSVHAFATDPERGVFILVFLVIVIGCSLLLYTLRAADIKSNVSFAPFSKESFLLVNNIILIVVMASILLGTLYPLLIDAIGNGKISVGPPYFNSIFVPLTIPLAILVGIGALTRWKSDNFQRLWSKLNKILAFSIIAGICLPLLRNEPYEWKAAIGISLGIWVVLTALVWVKDNKGPGVTGLLKISRAGWGMVIAHIGIAVFSVGVSLTSLYSIEKDIRMEIGDSYTMQDYTFTFRGVEDKKGPNYVAKTGFLDIYHNDEFYMKMEPARRVYNVQTMPMTEAAIDAGFTRDLFVAIGEDLGGGAWSFRLYYKPFVRWLWLAGLLMMIGGLLAASDSRYIKLARRVRG